MTTKPTRIRRVPCPNGIPLARIHDVTCLCGHRFKVDLGLKWKEGMIIKCPKCKTKLGKSMQVIGSKWEAFPRLGGTQ